MMTGFRLNWVARLHDRDESGAALITALLAILVTAMFAIVMLGVLLSQATPTRLEQATTRTAFAAEAGINATVGQLRNIASSPDAAGNIYGNRKLLPCTVAGKVSAAGSEVQYAVTVRYFKENPTGRTDAWRNLNVLTCTPGSGPSAIATHALITSTGKGLAVAEAPGSIDRTVEAVYAFKITSNNIPGGHIYSWDGSTGVENFCLEATSQLINAKVKYVAASSCGSNEPVQLWVYDAFYRVQLASTTVPGFAGGPLCITAVPNGGTPVEVTLQKCKDTASVARYDQLWSWGGNGTWQAENNTVSYYVNYWLTSGSATTPSVGTTLKLWNQNPNQAGWGAFDPQAAVGSGGASKQTNEMVNALEFGRCADVTGGGIGSSFMISFPCKQDPTTGQPNLYWNHKWFYTEPSDPTLGEGVGSAQQIVVWDNDTTKYCLKSAGTDAGFVTFATACTPSDKHFQWTRTGKVADFDSSYTFKDGYGRCLTVDPTQKYQLQWSKLITVTCNFGLAQKWNAPPTESTSSLGNYWELN